MIYSLLFEAASKTLLAFGANPRWLGGPLGATLVLHTWGQTLTQHLHVHAVVTGGALDANGQWHAPSRGFLFPVKALSKVFRAKFLEGLAEHFTHHTFCLAGATDGLATTAGQHGGDCPTLNGVPSSSKSIMSILAKKKPGPSKLGKSNGSIDARVTNFEETFVTRANV